MIRGAILQGVFVGGRPRPARGGAAQATGVGAGYAFEVPETILSRRGGGKSLPEAVLRKMETALGADFSDVRVHVGGEASSIGALAFTHGSDIFFAPGLYDPHSPHGQRLLGHELVHVVQQRHGRVRNPLGGGVAVVQDPGLEAEAERMGMLAALQAAAPPRPAAPAVGARPGEAPAQAKSAFAGGRPLAPHVAAAMGVAPAAGAAPAAPAVGQARTGTGSPGVGGRAPAPHVAAALATHHRPAPPAAAAPSAGVQARPAAAPAPPAQSGGYRLVVGTYLHRTGRGESLPEDLAGHTFVAIQEPTGRRQAWGFSPDRYGDYDPRRDLGRLATGVQGKVHEDGNAFGKPGVRVRSFEIGAEQAQAALAKVAEYRSRHYDFSLQKRACSSFALDVARAAEVDVAPGSKVVRPRELYRRL
jgi:Domain of unknown function (DUF4157)